MRGALLLLLGAGAACATTRAGEDLARARITPDFHTYTLRRVGLMPFRGPGLDAELARTMQAAFAGELGRRASFEIVPLDMNDMEEVPASEPLRRGWTRPDTILVLARRYHLDAVFAGSVTEVQSFPPQRLDVELDLVAVETGLPIWSAELHLDAASGRTREALRTWHEAERASDDSSEGWELSLLSPRRFAEFAAAQIARVL